MEELYFLDKWDPDKMLGDIIKASFSPYWQCVKHPAKAAGMNLSEIRFYGRGGSWSR